MSQAAPRAASTQFDLLFAPGVVTRTEMPGSGATLRRVQVPAGTESARHSHAHEQFVIVVAGAGRVDCAAGAVELRPGTVLHFAPGAWHSAAFTADTVLVEVNLAAQDGVS